MSFLTTTKDASAIDTFSGGEFLVQEVNANGTQLSSPDTIHNLGFIRESTISDDTPITDYSDETGDIVASIPQVRSYKISGVMMQSASAQYEFAEVVRNKFYLGKKYEGVKAGQHLDIWTLGQFKPSSIVKHPDGTFNFEFTAIKVPSAITIALSAVTGSTIWASNYQSPVTLAVNSVRTITTVTAS